MQFLNSKKQSHGGGAWFSTHKAKGASDLTSVGPSDPAEAVLMVAILAVYAFFVWCVRRCRRTSNHWAAYRGFVYCQIYHDDLRFFETVRGTTRTILKPPAITRPLGTLTKFRFYGKDSPKVCFTFSDGFEVELYSCGTEDDLTKFRETLYSKSECGEARANKAH